MIFFRNVCVFFFTSPDLRVCGGSCVPQQGLVLEFRVNATACQHSQNKFDSQHTIGHGCGITTLELSGLLLYVGNYVLLCSLAEFMQEGCL